MPEELDYSTVSEAPGLGITQEADAMLATRYAYAARFCESKDVLELACGAGLGLGYLGRRARRVIGGDYTHSMLCRAQRYYGDRLDLVRLDAHSLPFLNNSFDVVLLLEAIYYLSNPKICLEECRRVLRPGGLLFICTVNKEWNGFSPSGFSTVYLSAQELNQLLNAAQFETDMFGGFPATSSTWRERIVAVIRRVAVGFDLIPKTMKTKQVWKRLFYGRLVFLKPEIEPDAVSCEVLKPVNTSEVCANYKVLYAVATSRCSAFQGPP